MNHYGITLEIMIMEYMIVKNFAQVMLLNSSSIINYRRLSGYISIP